MALAECTFFLTLSNPPDTVNVIDDMTLDISGGKFVARSGTVDAGIRADIVAVTDDRLILRVQTPPSTVAATFSGMCVWGVGD